MKSSDSNSSPFFLSLSLALSENGRADNKESSVERFRKATIFAPRLFSATDLYGGWLVVGRENTDSAREFRGKVTGGKGRPRRERRGKKERRERRFPSRLIVSENLSNRSFCFRFYFLLSNLSGHWFPFVHTVRLDFSRSKTRTDFYPISLKREEL